MRSLHRQPQPIIMPRKNVYLVSMTVLTHANNLVPSINSLWPRPTAIPTHIRPWWSRRTHSARSQRKDDLETSREDSNSRNWSKWPSICSCLKPPHLPRNEYDVRKTKDSVLQSPTLNYFGTSCESNSPIRKLWDAKDDSRAPMNTSRMDALL